MENVMQGICTNVRERNLVLALAKHGMCNQYLYERARLIFRRRIWARNISQNHESLKRS